MIDIKKHQEKETKTEEKNILENAELNEKDKNTETTMDPKAKQIDELTDTLKRLQAEFENFKKRTEKENINYAKNANASLIKELLPVLDSFELALKNNHDENAEISKFKKGLEMIYAQLFSILENQGLRIIITKDKKFDPYKHEVLMTKESELPEDTILQEFQKGYMLNDSVLRHTKVMIAKNIEGGIENGRK